MAHIRRVVAIYESHPVRRLLYVSKVSSVADTYVVEDISQLLGVEAEAHVALVSLSENEHHRRDQVKQLRKINPRVPLIVFDSRAYEASDFHDLSLIGHSNRARATLVEAFNSFDRALSSIGG